MFYPSGAASDVDGNVMAALDAYPDDPSGRSIDWVEARRTWRRSLRSRRAGPCPSCSDARVRCHDPARSAQGTVRAPGCRSPNPCRVAGDPQALVARDGGCRFPACDRPHPWTDAHHIRHWAHGGPTAVANLVLLCREHHRVIHDGAFTVRMDDGVPVFTRPDGSMIRQPRGQPP